MGNWGGDRRYYAQRQVTAVLLVSPGLTAVRGLDCTAVSTHRFRLKTQAFSNLQRRRLPSFVMRNVQHEVMMNFIVFGNFFDLKNNNIQLDEHTTLKIADGVALDTIEELFNFYHVERSFRLQHEFKHEPDIFTNLPKDKWTYWILDYNTDFFNKDMSYLSFLLQDNVYWSFDIGRYSSAETGFESYQQRILNLEEYRRDSKFDLSDYTNIYDKLKSFYLDPKIQQYEFLSKALNDYILLFDLPYSEMRILFIFTILELLLTHKTKGGDDAISIQFVSKIVLINNQLINKIDFKKHFSSLPDTFTENKILEKLYSYRSCLAHGSTADFSNEFQHLVSPGTIHNLMNEILRLILNYVLFNKELIKDLKNC